MNLRQARAAKVRAEKALEKAEDIEDAAIRRMLVKCNNCDRRTRLGKLVYIQTHFYISPYSCTGGDYWKLGEGCFRCPRCNVRNRLFQRKELEQYKRLFASVEDTYDGGMATDEFVN